VNPAEPRREQGRFDPGGSVKEWEPGKLHTSAQKAMECLMDKALEKKKKLKPAKSKKQKVLTSGAKRLAPKYRGQRVIPSRITHTIRHNVQVGAEKSVAVHKDFEGGSKEVESILDKPAPGLPKLGIDRPGARLSQEHREKRIKETGSKMMGKSQAGDMLDSMMKSSEEAKQLGYEPREIHAGNVKPYFDAAQEHQSHAAKGGPLKEHHEKAFHANMQAAMDHHVAAHNPTPANRQKAWRSSANANFLSGSVNRAMGKSCSAKGIRLFPEPAIKSDTTEKAYLGSVNIGKQGATFSGSGTRPAGTPTAGGVKLPEHVVKEEEHRTILAQEGKPQPTKFAPSTPAAAAKPRLSMGSVRVGGASGLHTVSHGGDVLTSARATPPPIPAAAAKEKSMKKSAIEMLQDMMKCFAGNDANRQGPVRGAQHPNAGPAQMSVTPNAEEDHVAARASQGPVHGSAHMGIGPAQTSVAPNEEEDHVGSRSSQGSVHGTAAPGNVSQMNKSDEEDYAGKGPSQGKVHGKQSAGCPKKEQGPVHGAAAAGNESEVSKAVTSMSVPRLPRALAVSMDTWRSATQAMTRGNSVFAKHAGAGPLNAEVLNILEHDEDERTHRSPIIKSCDGCGRTYTLHKGMEDKCPSCSTMGQTNMAKSQNGTLISSFID